MDDTGKIIELDAVLEYKDGMVYIKKMNTNEMPVNLTFSLIEALNNTIVRYHKGDKNTTTDYIKQQAISIHNDIISYWNPPHAEAILKEFANRLQKV